MKLGIVKRYWGTATRFLGVCGLGVMIAPAQAGLFDKDVCCDEGCADVCCDTVVDPCCDGGTACGGGKDFGLGCCLGEPYTLMDALFDCPDDAPFQLYGWTAWGYTSDDTGLFNNTADQFVNTQTYLVAERVADGSCGLDFGFRIDTIYGTDAPDTQSFGNPQGVYDFTDDLTFGDYGWAFPQAYVEVASGDWSVIAGHFYTLVGYEVVTAPDNFFFSHAYTQFNAEPFTHTGVLATYSGYEDIEFYGGWVLGWDTGFAQLDGGSGFLGGFSTSVTDDITLTYITFFGDTGFNGTGYNHSIVADVAVTDDINYVFQSDFVDTTAADQYGINQYLFKTINDCLAVGGRFEWFNTDTATQGHADIFNLTGGINVRPHANVVIRPEVRYQFSPDDAAAAEFEGPGIFDEVLFATDVIITF
ncbi:MAG: outer membrane beta-barrel protein [Planctomycetota bacterium]